MRHLKTTFAVLGAVGVLVLAGNTIALATTGQALILGHGNSANATTGITRTTSGSALKLTTKSATNPPLSVNGRGKVTNLNADSVDGYNSTALRNRIYLFKGSMTNTDDLVSEIKVPNGTYEFSFSGFLSGGGPVVWCQVYKIPKGKTFSSALFYAVTQIQVPSDTGFSPGVSGAGAVYKASGDKLYFECGSTSSPITTSSRAPIQLVMTPTAIAGTGTLTQIAPRVHVGRTGPGPQ